MATNAAGYYAINAGFAITSGTNTLAKTQNLVQGIRLNDIAAIAKLKDGRGNVKGLDGAGRERHITVDIVPYDSGGNKVTAKANIKLPDPMAVITITDTGTIFDGTYNYVGGADITASTDGFLKISLPCEAYDSSETGTFAALT
mgnify:CR=1 FL=1